MDGWLEKVPGLDSEPPGPGFEVHTEFTYPTLPVVDLCAGENGKAH